MPKLKVRSIFRSLQPIRGRCRKLSISMQIDTQPSSDALTLPQAKISDFWKLHYYVRFFQVPVWVAGLVQWVKSNLTSIEI